MQKANPKKKVRKPQHQAMPGLEFKMEPVPVADRGPESGGKLSNKVAFITGGDSGIGRAVAILFAMFIIITGYRILRRSIAGIMDEADEKLIAEMVAFLNEKRRVNWVDLHNLRVIKYGSMLHIDCHLTVPWYLNVHEAHTEIDILAGLIRGKYGEAIELFVHSDGCLPFQCHICNKQDCNVRQHNFEYQVTWTVENVSQDKKHQ